MNAHSLYDLTCRLVLEDDSEDYSKCDELNKLLPSLRGALGCTACGNVLIDPHSPKHDICEHHVCRTCLGAIKHNLKPVCSWCKDSEMYAENKQLQIILKCLRKLCGYMKVSPIYLKLLEFAKQSETFELLNIINEFCDENYKSISVESRKHFLNHSQTSCNERSSVVLNRNENNLDVKVEFDNIDFRNSIDDEVFSEPSTNGEIQTICESDIAPVYKNSDDDEMYDDSAPILSPITEHINVDHEISENEDAPMLSPITECKSEINHYNDDHLRVQKESTAASISSNTETELNSDSSSMSSISSPVEILPSNIEPSEHPLQEYNITSESVLEFQATDLMGAADVNVLASLEDGSYSDLADITLSYPLTSISEESSKDSVIASIADNILSIQSSLSSDKSCEKIAITTLAASIEAEAIKSVSSRVTKTLDKPIEKSTNSLIHSSSINLPTSDSIAKCSLNSSTQISTPSSNILSQSSFPSSSQTTFKKVEPVPHYIRPQYNTQLVSCHSVVSSKAPSFSTNINNVTIGAPQIIQTPLSCANQVRTPIHQNLVHHPFISHHLVQQKSNNSSQVIQKHIPQSIGQSSFQALPGRPNLVVNSSISPVGITRMVLSPQQHSQIIQQQRSGPQNILNSSLQQHKLPSDIHASMNSASIPLSQAKSNISNNFISLIPEAALVQSTNDNTKVSTKETIMKSSSAYCSNASSVFSVKLSEDDSTKRRSPPVNKPYIFNQTVQSPPPPTHILPDDSKFNVHHQINNYINQNMKKPPPKPKSKPKPKRKGCRCGNATPSPGKLTCCGQRCPCYVEAKACIDCRCKGCRNPHRPGGKKVRPIIPHQDNIQIHQLQPVSTDRQAVAVQSYHHQPIQPKNNLVSHSVPSSVSTSQTFHAFQGVHAVEPIQSVASHQSVVSHHQFVKNCLPQDSCNKIISDGSLSNIIAMKPVKVLFDGNNVIKREYPIDTKMEPTI